MTKAKVRTKAPTHIEAMPYNCFLGYPARHKLTGLEGVISGFSQHLTGCDRYALQPKKLGDDGNIKEAYFYDLTELELLVGERVIYEEGRPDMEPIFIEKDAPKKTKTRGAGKDPVANQTSIRKQ